MNYLQLHKKLYFFNQSRDQEKRPNIPLLSSFTDLTNIDFTHCQDKFTRLRLTQGFVYVPVDKHLHLEGSLDCAMLANKQ